VEQDVDIPHVEVRFGEARELADALSVAMDLDFVIEVLTRLAQHLREPDPDGVHARAYWSAALIAYVRCFATGKRAALTPDVFEGISGPEHSAEVVHQHFKDMRDKHIAHSVNPFEQVTVALMLSPESSTERKVEGVGTLMMQHLSPTVEGVESLLELAKIARRHVAARVKDAQAATLAKGEEADVEALYEKAGLKLHVPGPEQAGRPRQD
jgi:hypothetical protein